MNTKITAEGLINDAELIGQSGVYKDCWVEVYKNDGKFYEILRYDICNLEYLDDVTEISESDVEKSVDIGVTHVNH